MKNQYDSIDIAKAVLCLFIVMIHIPPIEGGGRILVNPIIRIAIPLFFIFSSYFFFSKVNYSWTHDKAIVKRFVLRNLKLYAFWFIVLLPHTIFVRHYYELGFLDFIKTFFMDFFFGSTFRASWFIVALIEGTLIIYALRRIMPQWLIIALSLPVYVLCCLDYNYSPLFTDCALYQQIIGFFPRLIYNNLFVSFLWISIGMNFAMREHSNKKKNFSIRFCVCVTLVALVMLYAEQYLTYKWCALYLRGGYLTLVPLVCFLFVPIKSWRVSCREAKFLRAYSTIAYCSHCPIGFTWSIILAKLFHLSNVSWLIYILAILSTFLLTCIITRLERLPHLSWLKYSH